jgi:hypothetical protein
LSKRTASSKRKNTATKYTGELAKPITRIVPRHSILSLSSEAATEWSDYIFRLSEVRAKKMRLLFTHYSLNPDDPLSFTSLAYRLACEHVPGFREAGRPGRPRIQGTDLHIYGHVRLWRESHPGRSVRDACVALTKTPTDSLGGLTAPTALRRYKTAKRIWGKINDGIPSDVVEGWLKAQL